MHSAPHYHPEPPCGAPALLLPWHADGEAPRESETDWFPELHFEMERADAEAAQDAGGAGARIQS